VRLETEGDETEVDKVVIDALYEPMLHVLRNAIDHGVEAAARRAASGKPPVATIQMRGRREGDNVVVEIEDDGAGVDIARVKQAAVERGVLSAEDGAALSDAESIELIFEPGFSTASEVTDLSGRGVGMDVVRRAAERLGGRVSMESAPTRGSVVRFELPFSVMMTQVMTVESGGQVFGIPLDAIVESVRIARDRIRPLGAARATVHRDRTIPVLNLAEALGGDKREPTSPEAILVVVFQGGQIGALEVEKLGARAEIMLKPTGGLLSKVRGISGTTLLGDGSVLLILDIEALLT
jgi:two-component system, chemotaxis family, sensor kinase CheA